MKWKTNSLNQQNIWPLFSVSLFWFAIQNGNAIKVVWLLFFLSLLFTDDKDDKQDIRVLNELENIDDELEKENIVIVRIDNADEAKEYGLDHLPTLIYFEDGIPSLYEGDLMNEEEVLEWLILQKETATIEEVTDEILEDLIEDHEYVVAYCKSNAKHKNNINLTRDE